ncbi:MAG: hypothetical protein DRN20_06270 [Thermoplasmata archaeon]|nr:MAG: hypothetical protein DRN20_06270 [Thermoplasmata archaeon]
MLEDVRKSTLAYLSGVGFMSIILFFVFFMQPERYGEIYPTCVIIITLSALVVFFYVFDDLNFIVNFASRRDDPEGFREKLEKGTHFISAMILMVVVGMNLIVYRNYEPDFSVRLLIITLLTLVSVFLFLYSMFME